MNTNDVHDTSAPAIPLQVEWSRTLTPMAYMVHCLNGTCGTSRAVFATVPPRVCTACGCDVFIVAITKGTVIVTDAQGKAAP